MTEILKLFYAMILFASLFLVAMEIGGQSFLRVRV
ncbi:Nodule Cysteine-Rich (NCR) secreted peptide [Medicago truncatula]|uniref:Nodule Cysteine-Rich (NCR) secreted peptide n=1 Tax=Medicago truncatula TaxID=3880 RepID=A0A072UEA5_MEDTR|nr:Nodule Cysteine-Rich (NCR) secreted peptide [Medicago truncatula]